MLPIIPSAMIDVAHKPIMHTRAHFGMDDNSFIYLFTWDFKSKWRRKNPMAVLQAYVAAFFHGKVHMDEKHAKLPKPLLVLHGINVNTSEDGLLELNGMKALSAKPHMPRVLFLDNQMSSTETIDLFKHANAYVSLHQLEGIFHHKYETRISCIKKQELHVNNLNSNSYLHSYLEAI